MSKEVKKLIKFGMVQQWLRPATGLPLQHLLPSLLDQATKLLSLAVHVLQNSLVLLIFCASKSR